MSVKEREGQAASDSARRRRRLWSDDEKRQIVAETLAPGASVSIVARRHDLNANMLFTWRRQIGTSVLLPAGDAMTFVPAAIITEAAPTAPPESRWPVGWRLSSPTVIGSLRVRDVDVAALARVVKVLSRR